MLQVQTSPQSFSGVCVCLYACSDSFEGIQQRSVIDLLGAASIKAQTLFTFAACAPTVDSLFEIEINTFVNDRW